MFVLFLVFLLVIFDLYSGISTAGLIGLMADLLSGKQHFYKRAECEILQLEAFRAKSNIYMPSRAHDYYNHIYNMNANYRGRLWYSVTISYVSSPKVHKVVFGIGVLNETCISNLVFFITNEMEVFTD
jgi:hypothetical protein